MATAEVGLSSLLLGNQTRDTELEALFSAKKAPQLAATTSGDNKRPRAADLFETPLEDPHTSSSKAQRAAKKARKAVKPASSREILRAGAEELSERPAKRKQLKTNGDDSLKVFGFEAQASAPIEKEGSIIHESLLPGYAQSKAAKGTKTKRQLADADAPARTARTVFVGNVPIACVTSKRLRKALLSHLIALLPEDIKKSAKAETIRFRSLPLAEPVSDKVVSTKTERHEPVNHSEKRAAAFKGRGGLLSSTDAEEDDEGARLKEQEKRFLTTAQKRKVAAITGEINTNAESCVAFVMLDSVETTRAVISAGNGSEFEGKTLRVDAVRDRSSKGEQATEMPAEERKRIADEEKRTCYIGGLDFAETEEKLRAWVEETLSTERGEPDEGSWVERVRIVRDSATGLGKGFAYVLMQDRDCVDELLALPAEQSKLSKRKLRLQRCKSAAKLEMEAQKASKAATKKEERQVLAKLPKKSIDKPKRRDTATTKALASQLEGLSKEERKAYKAADPDRLARRAAKKQAKVLSERKERKRQARIVKAPRP